MAGAEPLWRAIAVYRFASIGYAVLLAVINRADYSRPGWARTVRNHVQNTLGKLHLHNRVELVRYAIIANAAAGGLYSFKSRYADLLAPVRRLLVDADVPPAAITMAGIVFGGGAGGALALMRPGPVAGAVVAVLPAARLGPHLGSGPGGWGRDCERRERGGQVDHRPPPGSPARPAPVRHRRGDAGSRPPEHRRGQSVAGGVRGHGHGRAVGQPVTMLETFGWFRGKGFGLIVEDLVRLPDQPGVIAEGFRLLPRLVQPLLAMPGRAAWLCPTPGFRRAALASRGSLHEIAGKTSDPERALRNLLDRDRMFTERLWTEATDLGLRVIEVNATMTEDHLAGQVTRALGLE